MTAIAVGKPTRGRCFLRIETRNVSPSGLFLPEQRSTLPQTYGRVLEVGAPQYGPAGNEVPTEIQVGDLVAFNGREAGIMSLPDGSEVAVCYFDAIIGIMEREAETFTPASVLKSIEGRIKAKLKHGPGGTGLEGRCDPDCEKCAKEKEQGDDFGPYETNPGIDE